MKKIRIFLALSALLLAIGGTFASHYAVDTVTYEWNSSGLGSCIEHIVPFTCAETGSTDPCTYMGSPQLRKANDVQNQCGPLLVKIP